MIRRIRQELIISAENTCYELECWQSPDGKYHYANLPAHLKGSDFGPSLKSYILYQYHHCHVSQPLLLEQFVEFGIRITSGQLSRIITHGHKHFHQEKESLLSESLQEAPYLQTDDTGARHKGQNGYCTFIGNHLFSYFQSTGSKSRINFLEVLSVNPSYLFNEDALAYGQAQGLTAKNIEIIASLQGQVFEDKLALEKELMSLQVAKYAIKTIIEAGLLAALIEKGLSPQMVILSDDAGQFNILEHALCWVHVERNLQKTHTYNLSQREGLDKVLDLFWQLYQHLKAYKESPNQPLKTQCERLFDSICD